MAVNAERLRSGNYRARVYIGIDPTTGKKKYKSITAPTREEAEMMAAQFRYNTEKFITEDITVKEALDIYIQDNMNDWVPSTADGYIKDARSLYEIHHYKIKKLNSHILKTWVNLQTQKGLSPKSIRNRYGLLKQALRFNHVDVSKFDVKLPKNIKRKEYAPEIGEVDRLYNEASYKLKICILLASRHSLRRGEIAALKYGDIVGNELHIHSDIVKAPDGSWVHKEYPKTPQSVRTAYLTDAELKLIGKGFPDEYIVKLTPSSIGTNFYNLKHRLGLGHIRFHDLRVYYASISAACGIPETYTAHQGGWKEGSQVLKDRYKKPIASFDEKYANDLNAYLANVHSMGL